MTDQHYHCYLEWLQPLADWQSFGVYLPGIKDHHIEEIEHERTLADHQKRALFSKWFGLSPKGTITWRDVVNALKIRKEDKLVYEIQQNLEEHHTNMPGTESCLLLSYYGSFNMR